MTVRRSIFSYVYTEPHSSIGSVTNLRTGGRWFNPRLDQYSFRGLMIVTATGFNLLSTCPLFWLETNIERTTGLK